MLDPVLEQYSVVPSTGIQHHFNGDLLERHAEQTDTNS